MIQSLLVEPGSRALIDRIAAASDFGLPVVIEMTAQHPGGAPSRCRLDAINFFEGVVERLDRSMPSGWSRSPGWSEIDRRRTAGASPGRLYLYLQASIGRAQLGLVDAAASGIARLMKVDYGLAMAPGIVMTSYEFDRAGTDTARRELARLIPENDRSGTAWCQYFIRARWITHRPAGAAPEAHRPSRRARLYLTLLQHRSTARRPPDPMRHDNRRPGRIAERGVAGQPSVRLVAGTSYRR